MRPARFALAAIFGFAASIAVALPGTAAAAHPAAPPVTHAASTPITTNGQWTVYHHDNAHTGFDSTQPAASGATAGWVSTTLDGAIYGEPLVYRGIVYVATLNNSVYALNQTDGTVVWSTNFGAPQSGGWQCGNINPTGVLGTGVIDTNASRLYVVGFLHQYLSYYLFGLDLATGTRMLTTQIYPPGFDWTIQQQRGALALSHDGTHVYVPFGGRDGDCGPYHGWVVGLPTAGRVSDELFETPSTGSGIWAAGGVLVDDSSSNVLFATGNAIPCSGAVESDSVIRTNASLVGLNYFQPSDWSNNWCGPDLDLGSASPVLISPTLAFSSGKYGQGFLINPTTMAGANTQLFPAQSPYVGADVCGGINSNATFGSFAYAAPYVYLECNSGGLVALHVNTSTPSFSLCDSTCASPSWRAGGSTTFGPPIVAGAAVWAVDTGGGGLFGFDATTGTRIFSSGGFGATHFSTPAEAGGQIFVSAGTEVRSFNIVLGCSTTTATAVPPTTANIGAMVKVTGSASGAGSGCSGPRYQFWILAPGSLWMVAQPYSPSAIFNWDTTGYPGGPYWISVWAKDSSSGRSYDSYSAFQYSLTAQPCTGMSASAAPPTSAVLGATVTITGTATGCPNPRYQLWMLAPGGTWTVVQPFSAINTFSWRTAGYPTGSYWLSVWARDTSSPIPPYSYDRYAAFQYQVTVAPPCTGMTASVSPLTSALVGTTVTLSGAATGCSNPRYQFWILAPGRTWAVAQPYSSSASFSWNTAGWPTGSYWISVWARDAGSSSSYDSFGAFQYQLTAAPPCTSVSASASPPTSAAAGATVTLSGTAGGCPNPRYQFWILAPGGVWTVVQPYSAANTFAWLTTGYPAGSYWVSVWARDAGSAGTGGTPPDTYDAFGAFQYTLT